MKKIYKLADLFRRQAQAKIFEEYVGSENRISGISPTDVDFLLHQLKVATPMRWDSIGKVGNDDIPLLLSPNTQGPRILISAGFHGEEPAGCWGILKYLSSNTFLNRRVQLSVLPIINPTGIRTGRRFNDWGENTNDGFCHTEYLIEKPSREGILLLKSLPRLLDLAADGFISLHEDIDMEKFFVFTFERNIVPSDFTSMLVSAGGDFFDIAPDDSEEGLYNGVIFKECDGSFEDLLFHKGIPWTACTETPGRMAFDQRVAANANIIDKFCEFVELQ